MMQLRRGFARELAQFLETTFSRELGEPAAWWDSHVIQGLSIGQKGQVRSRSIERLGQLDLHALLRVFDRNWGELTHWCCFGNEVRTLMKGVADQRNDHSHEAAEGVAVDPADLYRDADTLLRSASALRFSDNLLNVLAEARIEALAGLAAAHLPHPVAPQVRPSAQATTPPPSTPPALIGKTAPSDPTGPDDPVARVFGPFRIHGPEESLVTEIQSFRGNPVRATEIPWRLTGPAGLELMVHICLIDDPQDEDEIGQVFCDSRLNSPAGWDQVVRRLRAGIRRLEDGSLYMDLRVATLNPDDRATRKTKSLAELDRLLGFELQKELLRVGARAVGTRGELNANPKRQMLQCPCVIFDADDIFTPVAAWAAVTVSPLVSLIRHIV